MAKGFQLPKPVAKASSKDLQAYADQFPLDNSDRRVLAEEIIRLRSLINEHLPIPLEKLMGEPSV